MRKTKGTNRNLFMPDVVTVAVEAFAADNGVSKNTAILMLLQAGLAAQGVKTSFTLPQWGRQPASK